MSPDMILKVRTAIWIFARDVTWCFKLPDTRAKIRSWQFHLTNSKCPCSFHHATPIIQSSLLRLKLELVNTPMWGQGSQWRWIVVYRKKKYKNILKCGRNAHSLWCTVFKACLSPALRAVWVRCDWKSWSLTDINFWK